MRRSDQLTRAEEGLSSLDKRPKAASNKAYDVISGIIVNSQGVVTLLFDDSSIAGWHTPTRRTSNQAEALEMLQIYPLISSLLKITADANQMRLRAKAEQKAQHFALRAGIAYERPG
jgi:hypothetical protein